ncbi:MAG: RagB/SusD family nutrient uptake outer membrane protein [Bacteroidales bacterium]
MILKKFYNKIALILTTVSLLFGQGCSDFLSTPPLTDFTDNDFWESESSMRSYAWGFYDQFYGYGRGGNQYAEFYWQTEGDNDSEMKYTEDLLNSVFLGFPNNAYTSNDMWEEYFANVRKSNLLLSRVKDMPVIDEIKNHWTGVGLFFRANTYFALLSSWGSVPLVTEYVYPEDLDKVYAPRADRKVVADQIIKDLNDAIKMLRTNDGACAVNKDAASALLARVALFEGTFRKYHGLGDYETYLKTAADAAKTLIANGKYHVSGKFKSKYCSDDLAGNSEIIFYKHYEKNVMMHTLQAYTHSSSPAVHGLTKYAVESYVCNDGLPITQSPLYKGDRGIDNVRANRDNRLNESMFDKLGYYGKPYADLIVSSTGYVTSLWDNPEKDIKNPDVTMDAKNHIDAPIFTISEMYLIYAEALAELGKLTQDDLNISINNLRTRAGVAPLQLSGTNAMASGVVINDPKRISPLESATKGGIVNSIIWEIRRERRAELLGWLLLRHQDIDRWAKGEYMSSNLNPDVLLGAWIGKVPDGSTVKVNSEGYINNYPGNARVFNEKYYLDPIPLDEKILYEAKGYKLEQNPGW